MVRYKCQGSAATVARMSPVATVHAPRGITNPGPNRSMSQPMPAESGIEARKPNEKTPAVSPRDQPVSSRSGGNRREKAVRLLAPMPIVTNATATTTQP